jgi:REP-associated tyrosine transposase
VGRSYVQYFNYRYQRTGTLWEGRYKSTLLDSEQYLLTCYRYIEMNPVRAGMVKAPAEYPWSSYQVNAHGKQDRLINPHELYLQLAESAHDRQSAYQALFYRHIDSHILNEIRQATNTEWVLGNARFRERIEALTGRQVQPKSRGGDRKSVKKSQSLLINRH